MSAGPVHIQIARYDLDMLPEEDPDRGTWALSVEYAGEGYWRVARTGSDRWGMNLGKDGTWGYRPCEGDTADGGWFTPSDEDWAEFRAVYRWTDPQEAIAFAVEFLPRYMINGRTAAEWQAELARRDAEEITP